MSKKDRGEENIIDIFDFISNVIPNLADIIANISIISPPSHAPLTYLFKGLPHPGSENTETEAICLLAIIFENHK